MKLTKTARKAQKRVLTNAQIRQLKQRTGLSAKVLRKSLPTGYAAREQKRKAIEKKARQLKRKGGG